MPKPATCTRTIQIKTEDFEELEAYAEATGVTVDAVIAEAISEFVIVSVSALLGDLEPAS